jgi:hypothetical protein
MPTVKTAAQRKADERQRQREAGRVAVTVWVHPEDRARVQRYAERANRQRDAKEPK